MSQVLYGGIRLDQVLIWANGGPSVDPTLATPPDKATSLMQLARLHARLADSKDPMTQDEAFT